MLIGENRPYSLETAKDFYKTYKDKPALLVKDHPELKSEVSKKVVLSNNFGKLDYFESYNDWLLDWCFACFELHT